MATATEAPASSTAEGPTQHTQNQASRLTAPQLRLLHRPVDPKRIGRDDKGFSHMEAWDIKRYLIRVFGFGGYDTENRELTLVREIEIPAGNKSRWTVVYRAQVRLIVKDVHGRELAHWDGEAAGDASNQPKLGDAHDMAMKTASSQALKRAATHLGDSFGLSLYNDGSKDAVVNFSAAHPPEQWEKVAAPLPEPNDAPVRPEPGSQTAAANEDSSTSGESRPAAPGPAAAPSTSAKAPSEHLAKLLRQTTDCWKNATVLAQIRADGEEHKVLDEEFPAQDGTPTTLRVVLDTQIAGLRKQAEQQRRAA